MRNKTEFRRTLIIPDYALSKKQITAVTDKILQSITTVIKTKIKLQNGIPFFVNHTGLKRRPFQIIRRHLIDIIVQPVNTDLLYKNPIF